MSQTWMIAGMALLTFAVKAAIFVLGGRIVFAPWLQRSLGFVPVSVLTAIVVPMVLAPQGGGLELHWHNPQLVASVVAVLVCAATRRQLLTIGIALLVFFGWQFALRG